MAIGDNNNSNLFGTNYNAEEEERKKAELAAQNARMGAGSPTSVGAESVPASAPNPVTFLPYADDVSAPRASALSVFTPGGDLKPGIDVNAITPAPEMISPSAVNTALNQEVPVESQVSSGPDFSNMSGTLSPFTKGVLSSLQRGITQPQFGMMGIDPRQNPYQDTLSPQAPSGASDFVATPSVTPPVERPTAGAQEQPSAVVSPFLQSPDTPSGLGGPLVRGFEMVNDAARGPNAPMGQDATRAAIGGMTLNEYLNAPAGTPGVSGLRTDPQGRMITPSAQPPVDSAVPTTVAQPPVDSVVPSAVAQPPVDALSSFEQDSLERQQRIGGTGSFEGDSAAREARLRANERQPGESQTERDTRVAQSRTTGGQTEGLSFDDARRRAEGQLAARGVRNPSASQVNALARSIQAAEPERLESLKTQRAINEARLKTAQATLDRPEFEGKVYTVNGVTFAQTSRGGAQVIDTGTETAAESTAKMKDFVFTLEQIDKAREAYSAGDADRANDILTAAGVQKNGIDVTANEYFGDFTPQVTPPGSTPQVTDTGFTQQQEAGIQRVMADNKITREEAVKALKESGQLK